MKTFIINSIKSILSKIRYFRFPTVFLKTPWPIGKGDAVC